jgi:hypothetical protein
VIDGFIYVFVHEPREASSAIETIPCHALSGVEIEAYGSGGEPASVCVLAFSQLREPLVMAVEARDDKLDEIKVREYIRLIL